MAGAAVAVVAGTVVGMSAAVMTVVAAMAVPTTMLVATTMVAVPTSVMVATHAVITMHALVFGRVGDRLHLRKGRTGRQGQGGRRHRAEKSFHLVLPRVCPPWA